MTGGMELIHWEIRSRVLREDVGSSALNYLTKGGADGRTALQGGAGTGGLPQH